MLMKRIFFMPLFFVLLFFSVSTITAADKESVKEPTIKDLQGKWEGKWGIEINNISRRGAANTSGIAYATFTGTDATWTFNKNRSGKITIAGNEINITDRDDPSWAETCKLFAKGGSYILECEYSWRNPGTGIGNGKATLEKK
jgi:hypothetical protein